MEYPPELFEVLVVDNAPDDDRTEQVVAQFQHRHTAHSFSYLTTAQIGASVARNLGLEKAQYPHVLFLDDDLSFSPQLLSAYNKAWQRYPDATMIGGKVAVVRLDGQSLTESQQRILASKDAWCLGATLCEETDTVLSEGGALVSANFSYHNSPRQKTLFHTAIGKSFLPRIQFGSEDYELCQRLILEGKKLVFVADEKLVVHNRVPLERFSESYLNTRYWLHGMEMAAVEVILLQKFPLSCPIYRGFLQYELTHVQTFPEVARRFLSSKREWIRLFSYLLNGRYMARALSPSSSTRQ